MLEHAHRLYAPRQRQALRDPHTGAAQSCRCAARGLRPDRYAPRLRARRVRRLHGTRRRQAGACLPDVRGAGAGQGGAHGGRACGRRELPSAAAGLLGTPRAAVRLLHAGLPDAGRGGAGSRAGHRRRGAEAGPVLQPLPLYRLPEHPQGGARGRGRDEEAREVKYIGRSLRRLEDRTLLLGRGEYAADLSAPGQLHMRVVRSSVAHGRLLAVHKSEARAHPGVHAVWSYDDVRHVPPIGIRLTRVGGLEPYQQTVLAKDEVRYVGEPAAVVFADDPYAAEDAAELVGIEIDELPAIVSPLEAPEAALIEKGYGDLAAAFAAAHAVIELEVAVGRHSGVPLETRGALAEFDPASGILTMKGAAKVPHYNRDQVARMLDLPADMVHLIEGHVGGGFGVRGELYPEDVLVCHAALRLKRSVKWIEDRFEHLIAANHSRDQIHRLRAAVDADGFVLGLEDEIFTDQGAYIRTHGVTVSDLACAMLPGPYVIPAYRARAHVRLTNKTPCGTYRAPGRYESTFARERLMDAVAARLRLDPMQVRRRNFIAPERMPFDRGIYTLGTRVVYDSGNYALLLDKLLARLDYPALKQQLADRRAQGEKVGLGIALFVEKSGLGPADKAVITLEAGGTVEIVTGAASIGQGIETGMAQICAEVLDIAPERMRVLHGRTHRIDHGMGAFASRVPVVTGGAGKAAPRGPQ